MVSYSGQQQAEMEEFNRQRQEEVTASQQVATTQPPSLQSQPQHGQQTTTLSSASLLSQQPYLGNPMGGLPGQLNSQHLLLLHQQHQLQQQLDRQAVAQTEILQSMINLAQQQSHTQQQQQGQSQLDSASRALLIQSLFGGQQPQPLPISQTGVPNNQLHQHEYENALARFLESQGRFNARQQQNLAAPRMNPSHGNTHGEPNASSEACDKNREQQQAPAPAPAPNNR